MYLVLGYTKDVVLTMVRVCKTALLALSLCILTAHTVYAVNSDDIRRLVGKPEIDTVETHDYLDYANSVLNGESKETLKGTLIGRVKGLSQKEEQLYADLKGTAKSGELLSSRVSQIAEFIGVSSNLEKYTKVIHLWNNSDSEKELDWYFENENIIASKNEIEYMDTLTNDTFDIGGIGIKSQYPIKDSSLLVTGGFNGTREDESIKGAYFHSVQEPELQAVQSLTNGIVTEINSDEYWGNWLKVQSGKGVSVSYSLLKNVLVKVGDTVKQGSILSKGTRNGEVYVETKLDGDYINPCVFLGAKGEEAHNKWYNEYPSDRGNSEQLQFSGIPTKDTSSVWEGQSNSGVVITEETQEVTEPTNAWSELDENGQGD